jgi:hypothetical protein
LDNYETGDLFAWAESHARPSDPETSTEAAFEIAQKHTRLEEEFLQVLRELGEATSNEVAVLIAEGNVGRINTMRRRASDLLRKKSVVALEPRKCQITGKKATVYKVMTNG